MPTSNIYIYIYTLTGHFIRNTFLVPGWTPFCLQNCFNLLASTPQFGTHSWKRRTKLKIITGADFSVPHKQFWCLCKEDPLGLLSIIQLIMLKKIISYRDWSALKKEFQTEWKKNLYNNNNNHIKIHEISSESRNLQSRKVMGWNSHVSLVYISTPKKLPWAHPCDTVILF